MRKIFKNSGPNVVLLSMRRTLILYDLAGG